MSDTFYMLEAPASSHAERKRRNEAVVAFLRASGHRYNKRANMFATREEAEQMVLRMGFPYPINIREGCWAF